MFLIQHGHGNGIAGGKIRLALASDNADGVIWSTGEYKPSSLEREIRRNTGSVQMLDPQMYVPYTTGPLNWKRLRLYPWVTASRRGGQQQTPTPTLVRAVVDAALAYQLAMPDLTAIVAPSTSTNVSTGARWALVRGFNHEAASWWRAKGDGRPLFASLPLEGALLDNDQDVHALLGAVRQIGVAGFYVIYELEPTIDDSTYTARLERALWLTHRLAEIGPVRVGYTGLSGWLFRAAGAEATASGWYQNRRWWTPNHWRQRSGGSWVGRAALEPVIALMTPSDLAAIRDANAAVFQQVVAGTGQLAAALRANPIRASRAISLDEEAAQLFAVCRELDSRTGRGFQADGRRILRDLANVDALRAHVAAAALIISGPATDSRVVEWQAAIRRLAARLGIQL